MFSGEWAIGLKRLSVTPTPRFRMIQVRPWTCPGTGRLAALSLGVTGAIIHLQRRVANAHYYPRLFDRPCGLVMIAAGAGPSTLEPDTGEMLQVSDYAPGVQTIAGGLLMIGVAQAPRLLLEIRGR